MLALTFRMVSRLGVGSVERRQLILLARSVDRRNGWRQSWNHVGRWRIGSFLTRDPDVAKIVRRSVPTAGLHSFNVPVTGGGGHCGRHISRFDFV